MAKPKLALIPAAQGSKFYSVLPSSGVGDFDFTRSGSATRINSQGLIEEVSNGQSRLNYPMIDGKVVGCPSLLLEPQRTNLCSNSKVDAYSKSSSIVRTLNNGISPLGINDAVKLEKGSSSAEYYNLLIASTTLSSTTTYSHSIFIKRDGSDFDFTLEYNNSTNYGVSWNVDFTINSDGVFVNSAASAVGKVERYINDWYKVTAIVTTATPTSALTSYLLRLKASNGSGASILLQDHQFEQGSYPTSYIPTNGSTVTRSAEVANGSGDAATFNDSEGVLMAEISAFTTNETRVISISDGSTANNIYVNVNNTGSIGGQVISGGTAQCNLSSVNISPNISQLDFNKIAITYKVNDFQLWINGIKVASDNSGITFEDGVLNRLNFDFGTGAYDFYGNTKQLQYYDSALTDSELETLTSWVSFSDMANGQLYTIQ